MKRIVVFGIFDGVHEGHRDLFRQARKYGEELVVVVGRDEIAESLKGKRPKHSGEERLRILKEERLVDTTVLGDRQLSIYKVLENLNPDVICVGYDQEELREDLRRWMKANKKEIPMVTLKPYKSEVFHSSLLK